VTAFAPHFPILNPVYSDMTEDEIEDMREYYEEKAALLEFRDNATRKDAEKTALTITALKYGFPVSKMRGLLGLGD